LEDKIEEVQKKKSYKYKVLVVDDEEPLRNMVVAFLSREGHQCVTASNGIEALSKIHENDVDAVITDIVMPQMDGIALTKELLSLYPKLPVMIMTGHSKEYPTESAIIAGARDFIGKPFSLDEFILRFNKMMSDHKISLGIESKQSEMIFHIQRESSDRINELQREVEGLKRKLYGGSPFKTNTWL
ncbi:MAG TPA: response regulator, partial [Thermodesulfobacteriota bacterium]|nr:response regulator [Thermodesulfobacteriota bacterium]